MRLCRFHPNKEVKLELSTTSLIDVVFLLLIFFLVTTTFLLPERQLKPNIKIQQTSAAELVDDIEPAIIDIVRKAQTPVYQFGTLVTDDIVQLEKFLSDFPNVTKGAFVRLSDDVPYGMAAKAINVCKKTGFTTVSVVPLR